MAHSIQIVGKKIAIFKDLDLLLMMRLIESRVREESDLYSELQEITNRWRDSWENYGPGTIDMELEEIAKSPAKRYAFLSLMDSIKQWLISQAPVLHCEKINKEFRISGVVFFDYRVDFLISTLDKIEDTIIQN
jgi:hypothetical protein